MGAASARAVAPASHAVHLAEASDTAAPDMAEAADLAEIDMTDCEAMMQKSAKGECPCCDVKSACPPDLCLCKCFKVFSGVVAPAKARVWTSLRLVPGEPQRPPDWIVSLQLPPPRA